MINAWSPCASSETTPLCKSLAIHIDAGDISSMLFSVVALAASHNLRIQREACQERSIDDNFQRGKMWFVSYTYSAPGRSSAQNGDIPLSLSINNTGFEAENSSFKITCALARVLCIPM